MNRLKYAEPRHDAKSKESILETALTSQRAENLALQQDLEQAGDGEDGTMPLDIWRGNDGLCKCEVLENAKFGYYCSIYTYPIVANLFPK